MQIHVKEQGAVGDGRHKDTAAVQKAIDCCFQAGGGRVVFSDGIFLCGTLYLKSNVILEIREDAELLASPDIEDYGTDTHYNRYRDETALDRCFLYGERQSNLGICGFGKINGNADAFPNKNSQYRPMLIRFLQCSNIRLSDVRLYNAAAWTTAFLDCSYIWVRGADIRNEKRYNGDGLDFDGCSHVFVSDCHICGTDDNLCLQAGNERHPMTDVHISGCSFTSLCAAVRIGLKSIGEISNVTITGCTMYNVWREGIKIECTEGGSITDVLIQNIVMRNVSRPLFLLLNNRFEPDGLGSSVELDRMPPIGKMERIHIQNVTAVDEECMAQKHYRFGEDVMGGPHFAGVRIDAERRHPIKDLMLADFSYRFIGGVRKDEIPAEYPEVKDRLAQPEGAGSENYYPDWSRTAFMDIRNVERLVLRGIQLETIKKDERKPILLEGCEVLEQTVLIREGDKV